MNQPPIKKKKKKRRILRTILLIILVFCIVIGYNAYMTVEGFKGDAVELDDDPRINTETNTLAFWLRLRNDGYLPISLNITVSFTDLRHDKFIGEAQQTFEIGGTKTVNKTLLMHVTDEFVEYAKEEDGLYIEIVPTVKGTYAGYIPIPETTLESKKHTIHTK